MSTEKQIFMERMPMYTNGKVQCINGLVTDKIARDAKHVGASAHPYFIRLFSAMRPGMTLMDCWRIWDQIVDWYELHQWLSRSTFNPGPDECWRVRGIFYHMENGKVQSYQGTPRSTVYVGRAIHAFDRVKVGMSLEDVRIILTSAPTYKKLKTVHDFDPPVTATSLSHERQCKRPTPKERLEFLSTHNYMLNIFYPHDDVQLWPEQVQVVLYALTRIWDDKERTQLNQEFKNDTNSYFAFGYKCIRSSAFYKDRLYLHGKFKPSRLRVTRDCCIEVDFNVCKEMKTDADFAGG